MDYLTYEKRLNYLEELIRKGRVDSPQSAAKIFNCTEKTIRNMINTLRDKGCQVEYCRKSMKYFINN